MNTGPEGPVSLSQQTIFDRQLRSLRGARAVRPDVSVPVAGAAAGSVVVLGAAVLGAAVLGAAVLGAAVLGAAVLGAAPLGDVVLGDVELGGWVPDDVVPPGVMPGPAPDVAPGVVVLPPPELV
jgi:hypothetical protein